MCRETRSPTTRRRAAQGACWLTAAALAATAWAGETQTMKLEQALRRLRPDALDPERARALRGMLADDLARRIAEANRRSSAAWRAVRTRDDWQRLRDAAMGHLRKSLGTFPAVPRRVVVRTTGRLAGRGHRVDKVLFETRPGLWVTANLYRPAAPTASMPALLICHSHHAPKDQAELQDMGVLWARRGCVVLVPDLPGHGERRQHPFATAGDYDEPFRVGRQDYYFRYDTGMQLDLAGESLMGWFVWDLWRCVDVLRAEEGVDRKRIVLLGAVAGGGDPAAVAAALDPRIAGAVIFNFGGPQPETPYPLGDDAEATLNYAGTGSFESTRNLRRSAADGFLPWLIVGAIAPRRVVYAHEFSWDRGRDPVWKRLERIWSLYGARDALAGASGRGVLSERPPKASHCTNIGRTHLASIHPLLERWFGIAAGPDAPAVRREREELTCWTRVLRQRLKPKRLCELLGASASRRSAAVRATWAGQSPAEARRAARAAWALLLGNVEPTGPARVLDERREAVGTVDLRRLVLGVERGMVVPAVLLAPAGAGPARPAACVVGLAEGGKTAFLRRRARQIAELLDGGLAVCLIDVRATGETRGNESRERWGRLTAQAATELMLGGTLAGSRVRDVRAVLRLLRRRKEIDARRIALWGDALVEPNPPTRRFAMPRHMDGRPRRAEPLGGMLAMLTALFEDDVAAVAVAGGLSDFGAVLAGAFVTVARDTVVPGAAAGGDLPGLAALLAPRPLCLAGLVDGQNRRHRVRAVRELYRPATDAYARAQVPERLVIRREPSVAAWLLTALR